MILKNLKLSQVSVVRGVTQHCAVNRVTAITITLERRVEAREGMVLKEESVVL